ncbi:MAG TPA: type II toxin-antitoxin system VapC family toxin [Terracidiphilus sp.]
MDDAFWDASALVPLCVRQRTTSVAKALSTQYRMAVWWSTPIEMRGAFARLVRMGQLPPNEHVQAQVRLDSIRSDWREVDPSEPLREQAERLVDRFPLKAADAQQLAAAMVWCIGRPKGRAFISGDSPLLETARQLGFHAIEA